MPKGGKREGSGRKRKEERKSLVEKLSPYEDGILEVVIRKAKQGEAPFVKMFMEYLYGKPDQFINAKVDSTVTQSYMIGGRTITF
jgi:hypothetical protein